MKYIDKILKSWKTVFTYNDIQTILWISNKFTIKSFFVRWIKLWIFQNISKWIYALQKFDNLELATKLKKNSYISFETVLKKEWVIFQDYGNSIFVASDQSINKQILNKQFTYLKLKNSILTNPIWIANKWNYMIASAERAICDRLYLSPGYYLDNLENIDKEKLQEISLIYNKRVILEVNNLIKNA